MPVRGVYSRLGLKMQGKSSVCRCLFGQPNHDELRKDLDAQLNAVNTDFTKIWNFDPVLDKAVDGRLDWEKVNDDDYVPEFYRKGYQVRKAKARRRLQSPEREIDSKAAISSLLSTPSRVPIAVEDIGFTPIEDDKSEDMQRENETTPEAKIVPLRQSTLGEFMRVRKRRLSDEFCSSDDDDRPAAKSQKKE